MKIDSDLLAAFHAGAFAADDGKDARDNPHLYTSAMSDAWIMGHTLARRGDLAQIVKVLGFSSRGMTYRDAQGRTFRYRVSYVQCTQGHDVWRAAA